ncbi:hypothetical protein K450DRAFT_261206 [Umbelopsis ramanniana AG]|uniref:Peroxidase n=1 Tax=Umbelopsis ramanniana AG TaxID=1314678 RepID=A0AAD5H8D5_UMBRA|nr:uncharacterized protein K450DRAFT_261206 [Umbelopsis ramanniana AG]KAI8575552.1 hypothetical protein K450DRAFT_261206 [Umbelopsis ramanniana AG]
MASFLRAARTTAARRSTLLVATASVAAAPRARIAPQFARGYATGEQKKGGSGGLFLGLAALGAAGGYYYYSTTQDVKTKPAAAKETKSLDTKPLDYEEVYQAIADILEDNDYDDGSLGPVFVRLAWHASGTYDVETKTGGSNGATMRFEPEALHAANNGLAIARDRLEPIKKKFPEISYGDLWTLAGVCAVQELGGPTIPWRPGRQDVDDGKSCTPDGRLPDAGQGERHIRDIFYRMGFDDQEIVALAGAHSLGRCHPDRSGFEGPWQEAPTVFTNEYYKALRDRKWVKKTVKASGAQQWVDKKNPDVMMLPAEIAMYNDKAFKKFFNEYADSEEKFFTDFSKVFNKLLELGVPFKGDERVYHFKATTA